MKETMKLVQFGPVTEGQSAKGPWRKGVVVFETIGEYPKQIAIEFFNSKFEEASKFDIGDTCTVSFDISSREFNGKWYTNVSAFAIEGNVQRQKQPQQKPEWDTPAQKIDEYQSDLPF